MDAGRTRDRPSLHGETDRQGSILAGLTHGVATITVAMVAGIFFDWAVNIMPALSEVDDRTYLVVMQQTITTMNTGPVFLSTLTGAVVFTSAAAALHWRLAARAAARWVLGALLLYVLAMMITAVVHFPINDTLEHAGDPATVRDLAGLRASTEGAWVAGHLVRTAASMSALACLSRALWLRRDG